MKRKIKSKTCKTKYRACVVGMLLFFTLLGSLCMLAITPWGLRQITPVLEAQISKLTGLDVRVQGLTLSWPTNAQIKAFTARDEDGIVRLAIHEARVRISLRQLLRRNIRIYSFEADKIFFAGLPDTDQVPPKKPHARKKPLQLSDLEPILGAAEVWHFKIRQIVIAPPLVPEPLVLATRGHWRHRQMSIYLDTIAINWNDLDIAAEAPLHILIEPERLLFAPWNLQVGRGNLLAEGIIEGEYLQLSVDILELPLDLFGFAGQVDADTEMNGKLTVSGTLQNPTASLALDLRGLRPEDPQRWDGPPARFRVDFNLREQRLQGGFQLENLPGDPVTLDLNLPAPVSLMPFSFQWPPDGPIEARLSANTDLTGLGRLFVLDVYHRLVGTLAADLKLTGTFEDPRLDGSIRIKDGRYEHELSGTILSDILLEVAAEREFLSLVNFHASDGATGTLHASGRMHFRPNERYPFETTLTLDRFRLMQNDHAKAIGRGTLEWKGNLDESQLRGRVRVNPMTLMIPETLPPRLYALEVTEVYETKEETSTPTENDPTVEPAPLARRHQIAFDLRIDASDRIFVRGRGLDSEWSAHMQVNGQTPEPYLTGSLDIIRGRFIFFGKRLVIQQGSITFDGAYPPAPLLDIAATHRARDITATLRVQGAATDPEISLHSSPPLPEDEILARILFGRATVALTPWQAITLAQAINNLRGGGSAFDIMGETRRALRVDQIDIRTPDDEHTGTTITVGKYISDRIYVELERGVSEESGRAAVEVELTPSLRLETQTGGTVDSGIGIIWTRDY